MALAAAGLADSLNAKLAGVYEAEAGAVLAWTETVEEWFASAVAGPVPLAADGLSAAVTLFQTTLQGFSATGQGATKIAAATVQFWSALNLFAVTAFPTAIAVTPPPTLGSLGPALEIVFASNAASAVSRTAAFTNIASTWFGLGFTGGIAVFPPLPGGLGPLPIV